MDSTKGIIVTDNQNNTHNCTVSDKNDLNGVQQSFDLSKTNAAIAICSSGGIQLDAIVL